MRALTIEAAPPPLAAELPAGLDWAAFSARCYPNGRRHDFDAIAAYVAYERLPAKAVEPEETEVGVEAWEAWEDEGGSTP
jgi:hypothetical protein